MQRIKNRVLMETIIEFLSINRNFIMLGTLLVGLPVLLVLSQTQQVFNSQAVDPTHPKVITVSFTPTSTATTPYTPGQTISTNVTLQNAGHFDGSYIDATTNPNPDLNSPFTLINGLTGQGGGSYDWTVPTIPGRYFFVVNAHKSFTHDTNDWNPAFGDIGCAWDGFIYQTNPSGSSPIIIRTTPQQDCTNVDKKEFWVGGVVASPSPSASTVASAAPSPSPPVAVASPRAPVASRPPAPSPFVPAHLAAACITTDFACLAKDPIQFTGALYTIGLGLVGGVGVLFMIIGAYLILTSGGDPSKVTKGKEFITYSVIGILLALFGYAFYQIIAVDVLELPGFSR